MMRRLASSGVMSCRLNGMAASQPMMTPTRMSNASASMALPPYRFRDTVRQPACRLSVPVAGHNAQCKRVARCPQRVAGRVLLAQVDACRVHVQADTVAIGVLFAING